METPREVSLDRGRSPNGRKRPPLSAVGTDVFSVGQIATVLVVAEKVVCKWIDRGLLKGYRLPGDNPTRLTRRVGRKDLLNFIRHHGFDGAEARLEALVERRRRRWTR